MKPKYLLVCALLLTPTSCSSEKEVHSSYGPTSVVELDRGFTPSTTWQKLAPATTTTVALIPPARTQRPRSEIPHPVQPQVPSSGSVWDALADCESSGDWSAYTPPYYGGLQMNMDFWHSYGGDAYASRPDLASRSDQITVAERARAVRGYQPWPACSRRLGLQ